ncbi:MAG TPA: DNA polymerase III subunit alpha, partial [Rhabdochlamydiaceae bacterium]|nr:DNA polymerase III subunit alpha [Rhabdochlamydiaceae bacterium]
MWTELHLHSQYSILDSTASVQGLAAKAAEFKMEALALTDQGNLYGAIDFYKACKKLGVKPIIGCELFVAPKSRYDKKIAGQANGYPIVLLAKNKQGYQNLCKLSSLAHLDGFYYTPRIDKEILRSSNEGLICLSGPLKGALAQLILQDNEVQLREEILWYQDLFKEDFYFELSRHRMQEPQMKEDGMDYEGWLYQAALLEFQKEDKVNARLIQLAKEFDIACVATNDARYLERRQWQAHEILMNIQTGEPCEIWEKDSFGNPKNKVLNPKRKVNLSHEFYFKSPEEMAQLFADIPEALEQTMNIARKCHFEFDFQTKYYPVFVPPSLEGKPFTQEERTREAERFLRRLCQEGIQKKYSTEALVKVAEKFPKKDPLSVVRERVDYELDVIISKGMCDYLLIVYDFIAWAKNQGIPMGPGRGSGAGSIVCYLTGITDIEPLRFNLFFERFINPERISYPDLDIDICMDRRCEVIDYTMRKYGKEKVAQIITFGTMKAKMAIKDVGRTLNVPLSKVNQIAKLVPEDLNITLEKALEDPDLKHAYKTDEETKKLLDLAQSLEGCIRNTGIHAAGIIISADPILEHIPVCTAKDSTFMVTQYSMKPVEEVGMLKIDFLGLKTLTAIQV